MGLLSTEVEVGLVGKNISYYENLGYKIPRIKNKWGKYTTPRETKIKVKTKDLSDGSNIIVDCFCDECGKKLSWTWYDYKKHNHDGKTYCNYCSVKVLNSGKNNQNWNPNLTDEEREIRRNYTEYTYFIKSVLIRDNYTCKCCGKNADIVHHLYGYSKYKELRTKTTNGISLCNNCHNAFHSWCVNKYGWKNKGNCTKEQFEEWSGMRDILLEEYNGELPTARQVYCIEEDKIYNSVESFALEKNIGTTAIYNVCKRVHRLQKISEHVLYYDEYIKMTKEEVQAYIDWCDMNINHATMTGKISSTRKKVICITTGEIFDCIKEAEEKYKKGIGLCCIGKANYIGTLSDGTPLCWMYYEDYLKSNKKEIDKKLNKAVASNKKIVCTTTGEIFNSISAGSYKYGIARNNISKVCKGKQNYAGKLPDGTTLKWMYYEDFLKLPQEEQNEILARNKDSSNGESFNM